MTAPVPEDFDEEPISSTDEPAGEHSSELPDGDDDHGSVEQAENAGTSTDQPSQ